MPGYGSKRSWHIRRITDIWGERTPHPTGQPWPARVDQHLDDGRRRGATSTAGCSRRACCAATAAAGHRGQGRPDRRRPRPGGGPGQPRPARARRTCSAGRPSIRARPADPPADPRGRRAGRDATGTTAMGRIVERVAASCSTSKGRSSASASTPAGSCSSRSTTRSRVIGKAGHRHPAHGRQHPAVHGDRGRGAEGVASAPTASPAPTPTSTTATRSPCSGHNVAETQTVLWARMLDRRARRRTRRAMLVRRPAPDPGRARGRRPPGAAHRHQPGADERPAPRADRARLGRPRRTSSAHTLGFDELRGRSSSTTRRERVAEICDVPAERHRARRPSSSAPPTRLLSTVLQGFYQSHQATAASVPGQQPAPAARA